MKKQELVVVHLINAFPKISDLSIAYEYSHGFEENLKTRISARLQDLGCQINNCEFAYEDEGEVIRVLCKSEKSIDAEQIQNAAKLGVQDVGEDWLLRQQNRAIWYFMANSYDNPTTIVKKVQVEFRKPT